MAPGGVTKTRCCGAFVLGCPAGGWLLRILLNMPAEGDNAQKPAGGRPINYNFAMSLSESDSTQNPQPVQSGTQLPPLDTASLAIYSAIANRRTSWDTMLWQVPVISMTGQAFLLTIALGSDASHVARYISSALSVIAAGTSLILMAGHRRSELADADWLQEFEQSLPDQRFVAHGTAFRDRRRSVILVDKTLNLPERILNRIFRIFSRRALSLTGCSESRRLV